MLFVFIITFIAVFGGITTGAIKRFELNNIVLSKKQKMLFPIIVFKIISYHLSEFVINFWHNRELSIEHLKFCTVNLPLAFFCLVEVAAFHNLDINLTNWVKQYKNSSNYLLYAIIE